MSFIDKDKEKDMDKTQGEKCDPCENRFKKNLNNLVGGVDNYSQQSHDEKQQELESAFGSNNISASDHSDLMGDRDIQQEGIVNSSQNAPQASTNQDTCGRDVSRTGIDRDNDLNSGRLGSTQALTDQQLVEDNIKDDSSLNTDAINDTDRISAQADMQDDSDSASKDWSESGCGCGSIDDNLDTDMINDISAMDNSDLMGDSEIILINDVIFTDDLANDDLVSEDDTINTDSDADKKDNSTQQQNNISGVGTQSTTATSGVGEMSKDSDTDKQDDQKKDDRRSNMCM
ncbi:MAG: hypothetical protein LUG18_11160 [Candidatus Azobacteroides sp.]|nr:hypothetical protein [Candidatus Azobacteroides sp.]